ncbi:transposase [Streptomyces hintoniae]
MTIPGVDAMTAVTVLAAVGDFRRFPSSDKLVSYLGLNSRVRQSGGQPAHHGRITKGGCGKDRGMLVQATAVAALRSPGPLRALHKRMAARRARPYGAIPGQRRRIRKIASLGQSSRVTSLQPADLHLQPSRDSSTPELRGTQV